MKMTKQQKQNIQDNESRKKYLTSDWDGFAANEYFANLCDPSPTDRYFGKPRDEAFDSLREIAIADNKVYHSIAHLAFEKNKIITFLKELTPEEISVPNSINNKEKFKTTFMRTAREILAKLEEGAYSFQKPK
jgi:hypothetical protein